MEGDRADASARRNRLLYWTALVLALAPFVVAAVAVLLHGTGTFIRDQALMEMKVRDVGRHPVLTGLYSRDGWSHPGPLIFYTLAVPYRLAGSKPSGMLVGALAINAASIAGMGAIAKRLGGLPVALLTLAGGAAVAHALGTQVLQDPWVCFVTVLPFGVFCFLAWGMIECESWALPVAVAVASWLTQTHVGFAPLTVPALAIGTIWLWVAARRSADPRRTKKVARATILAALLLVVLWIPVIWDQLFGPGNLGTLIDWFTRGDVQKHTVTQGARIVLGQLALVPDWITGTRRVGLLGDTTLLHTTLWPVLLVPFALAVVVAWRARDHSIVRLAAVTTFMLVVSIVSVANTIGIMFEYRLLWTWVLGMMVAVVIAWTIWNAVVRRWSEAEWLVLVPIAVIALAVLGAMAVVDVDQHDTPTVYSDAAQSTVRTLARTLHPGGGEVVLRSQSNLSDWYLQGLLVGLERTGIDARVQTDPAARFGAHRTANGSPVKARLLVVVGEDLNTFTPPPGDRLVAYSGPVPLRRYSAAGRRSAAKAQQLYADLNDGKLSEAEFLRAFRAVKHLAPAVAVYREPRNN